MLSRCAFDGMNFPFGSVRWRGCVAAQHAAPQDERDGRPEVAAPIRNHGLRQRVRWIEDDARGQLVVGGEAGCFSVTQLAQVREFALYDLFVSRTQKLLFQGYE